jgi:uncharacterized membrane protein
MVMHSFTRAVSWTVWISFCIQIHAFRLPSQYGSIDRTIRSASGKRFSVNRLNSIPPLFQILPDNQWGIYATVAVSAATALRLERKTKVGKSLSGPVTAMLISAVLTNIGILPSEGSIYIVSLQGFVLKLATPMLLFGADLKKIFRETGVMLKAFVLGTLGTMLGSLLGFLLMSGSMRNIGIDGDSWKIASALCAKNVGGGLNFFAVADAIKLSPSALATGLAVDNLLGLLYFPFVSWLGAPYDENKTNPYEIEKVSNIKDDNISKNDLNLVENNDTLNSDYCNDDKSSLIDSNKNKNNYNDNDVDKSYNNDNEKLDNQLKISKSEDIDDVEKMTLAIAFGFTISAIAESISKATGVYMFLFLLISTCISVMYGIKFICIFMHVYM